MKKTWLGMMVALLTTMLLFGCQNNEQSGALMGGVAGGLLGSTVGDGSGRDVAIIVGALTGAVVGSKVGASMDEASKREMNTATFTALDNNERVSWHTDTAHGAVYTDHRDYQPRPRETCRKYTSEVTLGYDTVPTTVTGCACQRHGSYEWQESDRGKCR